MSEKQPRSNRRSFARGVLTVGGVGTIAGCTGNSGSAEDGGSSGPEESDTDPAGNGSDTGDSESAEDNSSDPEEGQEKEEQTPQWEKDTRNGIPLNGLGAYTDQMLEAGPVSATTAETINNALEGAETVEEEREALVEELSEENYEMLFSEYHRIKGKRDNAENSVVLNRNWSFSSDSEPIFEFYIVEGGELQRQPIILDPDPAFNNRQVNRPGSGEPEYLADMRDSTDGAQSVPEDYDAMEDLNEFYREYSDNPEKMMKKNRKVHANRVSASIFGVSSKEKFIFYDRESANLVANGKFENSEEGIESLVEISNSLPDAEGYGEEDWTSAEYTESGWEFRTHSDWELGQKLPGEQ